MSEQVRTFILDTNVLLHDPNALSVFKRNNIVIPMAVIEEIDKFKKDVNERGRNARHTSRLLDEMRQRGSLREGVSLPGGGTLRVDHQLEDIAISWGIDNNDNRILQTAVRLSKTGDVALVTRDTNMRLKCDALGVVAEDYENAHLQIDEQYSGVSEITVEAELIARLYAEGSVRTSYAYGFLPQSFVVLRSDLDESSTAMVRVSGDTSTFKLVPRFREGVWGVMPRNKEQLFALDLLLDPAIQLVTINGQAGTGKTLLAIAAGLKQVCDLNQYRKMLVSRPIFPLGKDIGFLPGDISEKLNPWMQPIFDNLEFLLSGSPAKGAKDHTRSREPVYQYLLDQKIIEVEPLTYIRGRSIPQQFMIVDECFPYETPIVTEDGQREIGDLYLDWSSGVPVPRVRSLDTQTDTYVWKEITHMWHRGKKALVAVHPRGTEAIQCTPNHLFYTNRGWVEAKDLTQQDHLVTEGGVYPVTYVESLDISKHVFDMEVADTHNFMVGTSHVIVHNCQNLSPHEVKTILTRAGENTKIVFTGDPQQIDNPHMDELSNGLTYAIERFKGEAIAGHVTLRKGERSALAELAAKLL